MWKIEGNESSVLEMIWKGLIDHMIEALGLDVDNVNREATLDEWKVLVNDRDAEVAHDDFCCSSAVGMMLYLSWYLHLDIAYAVNCAAEKNQKAPDVWLNDQSFSLKLLFQPLWQRLSH